MKSDGLRFVLREFEDRPLPTSKPPDLTLPTEVGKVIGLSGVSALRGRSITFDVFPLSFRELLVFRGLVPEPFDARGESLARAALADYLRWGGVPEIVLAEPALRPLILEEYSSLMLQRDLLERSAVRNEPLLRTLLRY